MIRARRRPFRVFAAVLTLALAAACGSPGLSAKGQVEESTTTTTIAKGPDSTAAQLRSKLAGLFGEHVYLAGAAVGANGDALAANMTAIFTGSDSAVATQFGALWKKQVDLVTGQAQGDLTQNSRDIGSLLSSGLPGLPAEAVSGPLTTAEQAATAGDPASLRAGAAQMVTLGSSVAGAIAKKYPDKIGGDPASKAADLVTTLNAGLREHVFLVSAATDAIVGGRNDQLQAASAAIDGNSDALATVLGGVYGPQAASTFTPLWKKHTGLLFDYATAAAAKQQSKADEATNNLLQFSDDFGAFVSGASPKVTKETASDWIMTDILTLKDVIDAQVAKNYSKAFTSERTAADQMTTIANNLSATVVAQFPQKF